MLYGIFFVELIFLYFEGCFCEFVGICCAILILSLGSGSRWGFPCQSLALFMLKRPWPRNPKLLLIPYLFCHMVALCHWCFSLCCRATKAERSNQCRLFYLSMKKSENVSSVWERCIYKLMFCSNQIKPSSSGKQLSEMSPKKQTSSKTNRCQSNYNTLALEENILHVLWKGDVIWYFMCYV